MAWQNLRHWLSGGNLADRERRQMHEQWDETERLWRTSKFPDAQLVEEILSVVAKAQDRAHLQLAQPVGSAACILVDRLLYPEELSYIEPDWALVDYDPSVAVEFRKMVTRRHRWVSNFPSMFRIFEDNITERLAWVLNLLPAACTGSWYADDEFFGVPLIELAERPAELVERLCRLPFTPTLLQWDICLPVREQVNQNLYVASGVLNEEDLERRRTPLVMPAAQKGKTPVELAEQYLAGTQMLEFAKQIIPFHIPDEARFEHAHIVGGTGHGKTQLMQRMIHHDLVAAQRERRAVVVIDSQGDLINKLVRLDLFSPDADHSLADRLVLIDPADVEFPCSLNLFAQNTARLAHYSASDRERVLNGVVELYEMFFSSMLGAELTQKQGVIFRYLARLMMVIPGATIHTLMQIMTDGRPFKPHMQKLDGSARYFFEQEFFHTSFNQTKQQILKRLWGVLSTPAFERMFAQKDNKLDLFEALNEGKIILISTAKDMLKTEGSALLGRFFIAMLMQATLERSTLAPEKRTPTYVYVDEAQEYFDDSIETILNQARKYKVGLNLAHQALDQLSPRLRSAILANTSLKCVGGVSSKDAGTLGGELRTSSDFIESMRKHRDRTEFAVWLKNETPRAIRLSVPLGFLDRQPLQSEESFDELLVKNRLRYACALADLPESPFATPVIVDAPPSESRTPRKPTAKPPFGELPSEKKTEQLEKTVPPPLPLDDAPAPPPQAPTDAEADRRQAVENETRPPPERPKRKPIDVGDRELGKGGSQHRYVQHLVKGLAEERGFRAVIEAPVAGGQVDVALYRDDISIGVEISVTSTTRYEVQNLAKCVAAKFTHVFAIAATVRRLKTIQTEAKAALSEADFAKVYFLTADGVAVILDELTTAPAAETVVKGYRVKVKRVSIDQSEADDRRSSVAKIIADSLRNKSGKQ